MARPAMFPVSLVWGLLLTVNSLLAAGPRHEPIVPIPHITASDPACVDLGQLLFFDPRLSSDNSISCASCHQMALGGTDDRVPSLGVQGREGVIKAPTVFNTRFNIAQFWDGRARNLKEQLDGPIHDPNEMNFSWPGIVERLRADKAFETHFSRCYPEGIQEQTLKDALARFEDTLVTPDSPFDRWLRGDDQALTEDQLQGYRLFTSYGCIGCHQGVNVGGNLFQKLGVMEDYFAARDKAQTKADQGRFNVTGDEHDRHYFKVPSLRLVSLQRYFFHDGSASSLDEAIRIMGRYQLGIEIPKTDRHLIAAFLDSLRGTHKLLPAP